MKKIITSVLCFILTIGLGFSITAPSPVIQSFNKSYPTAQGVCWKKAGCNWEAGFLANCKDVKVTLDECGKWLMTEAEISAKQLPQGVKNKLACFADDYNFCEATLITEPCCVTHYDVVLTGQCDNLHILMDKKGNIVHKHLASL